MYELPKNSLAYTGFAMAKSRVPFRSIPRQVDPQGYPKKMDNMSLAEPFLSHRFPCSTIISPWGPVMVGVGEGAGST